MSDIKSFLINNLLGNISECFFAFVISEKEPSSNIMNAN